jgi:hypothetical protein
MSQRLAKLTLGVLTPSGDDDFAMPMLDGDISS